MLNFKHLLFKSQRLIITLLLSLSLLSCGGETIVSAGISGTGIVYGVINGFGSIYVNGVEYDIDQASFNVDGDYTAAQNNLALGMVVRLSATDNGDGTGVASSVYYDDVIEGPIADVPQVLTNNSNQKQFTILGQSVIVDATSTTFNGLGLTFDNIAQNDVVEVSGFTNSTNQSIIATRVEKKGSLLNGDNLVELHGVIENLDAAAFDLKGITIDTSLIQTSDLEDLENGLQNGLSVEVKGSYDATSNIVLAQHIEGENDDIETLANASGELSLQGVVTDFVSVSNFKVDGITVDAAAIDSLISMHIKTGIQIQVKGTYSTGVLSAQQVEILSIDSEFDAPISSVDASSNQIEIAYPGIWQTITLKFDQQSQLVDDTDSESVPLSIQDLEVGMQVKAQVKRVGANWVVAYLKRDHLHKFKIRGYVTQKIQPDTIVINGLSIVLDPSADYEVGDHDRSMTQFFDSIVVTDPAKSYVNLEDGDTSDGKAIFDDVELDSHH